MVNMKNDFLVTVVDPESAAEWSATIGTCTLYVESPLPTDDAGILVYRLDLGHLTAPQRASLVEHLSTKFHISAARVEQKLDTQGLPILAAYCSLLGWAPAAGRSPGLAARRHTMSALRSLPDRRRPVPPG